jgi:hypothetical protein
MLARDAHLRHDPIAYRALITRAIWRPHGAHQVRTTAAQAL